MINTFSLNWISFNQFKSLIDKNTILFLVSTIEGVKQFFFDNFSYYKVLNKIHPSKNAN